MGKVIEYQDIMEKIHQAAKKRAMAGKQPTEEQRKMWNQLNRWEKMEDGISLPAPEIYTDNSDLILDLPLDNIGR